MSAIDYQAMPTNISFGSVHVWHAQYRLKGGTPQFVRDATGLPYRFMSEIEAAGAAKDAAEKALSMLYDSLRCNPAHLVHKVTGNGFHDEKKARQFLERSAPVLIGTIACVVIVQDGLYMPCAIVKESQTELVTFLASKGIGVILT